MTKFSYVVTDEVGIHGRPAGVLVKKCSEYKSAITIGCKGKTADAKRIMGVMSLGAKKGDTVEVSIDGEDEAAVKADLEQFFKENF
ncbi:MAG: HPr family phosphocarrier protein [Lachnospiraceae bacterium]|nr:HPr family phosphocarrier protein [Lachnospiraceae bacterium]